jgi:uncharacterized membrane protein
MFKALKRQFFSGLIIFVPLALTTYLIKLFFVQTSEIFNPIIARQDYLNLPAAAVRPISFLLVVVVIWFLGVVASNFIGKRIVGWIELGVRQIPFFRGLYEAIQKIAEAFFGVNPIFQSVVLVEYPRKQTYTFGFVTSQLPGTHFGSADPYLCVFVPTVPNPTSGVLLYVPKAETIPIDVSIEEVAKIIVSHGFMPIPEKAFTRR